MCYIFSNILICHSILNCSTVYSKIGLLIVKIIIFVHTVLLLFQDVFVLVTPVVEYDGEREKDFDRARKREALAYLFPEPTPVDDAQDRNSLWGQYKEKKLNTSPWL